MSKIRVSHMGCQRGARSAWLIGAAMLGLAVVPANAGAKQVTIAREDLAKAAHDYRLHLAGRAKSPPHEYRGRERPRGGLDHVVLPPATMLRIFPTLASPDAKGSMQSAPASRANRVREVAAAGNNEKIDPAVAAVEPHTARVVDGLQRFLAYELYDWGVQHRGSAGEDGTPGKLLEGSARDAANFHAAGEVLRAMDSGALAALAVRVVRAQAHALAPGQPDWERVMTPHGADTPAIEDTILNGVGLTFLGSLRDLRVTRDGVSVRALGLLLPDNAELPPPATPPRSESNGTGQGLVRPGGNFVPDANDGGYHYFEITE